MSSTEIEELKTLVQSLRKEVTKISDESAIRKLHHAYGYYLDKCLYSETVSLFADDASTSVEFLGGRYLRKEGVHRLYIGRFASRFVQGRNGPVHGFLLDHCQMQDIVDVDADGIHAKGRFRALMSAGTHKSIKDTHPRGLVQWWEGGVYENEYIKEDGVWKIWKLRYFPFWHAEFEKGWSAKEEGEFVGLMSEVRGPGNELGPDELVEGGRVVPFHYKHPVTGEDVKENDLRAPGWGEDVESSKPALKLN
ncbi:NTF2-like protein [Glarea lozoyensis ATCC 20868]|uniref:NTF2-like protein n=1 Tax=Glarea lozoyensis (strain ATCC 20868 / MF5171) TaxID=1116229 RepID=S3CWJ6_GLAL2|nr:NTF2-like protein [Glarea lozoyensis ATCC 20868]EPE30742.1 NTF2-like protein [Glarea lozoyensis ATCC 20868]